MIIGITGNSGSGKSEITKILEKKINAKIIDADLVVKELSEPGNKYYNKIIELFGKEILMNNVLNKRKIADIIYTNQDKREALNKLTYKYVVDEIKNRIKRNNEEDIIIDAPLLFESGLGEICDFTIGVIADISKKIERICLRDNIDEETAKSRLNIQAKDEFYKAKADYIITNNEKINEINLEDVCTKIGMN